MPTYVRIGQTFLVHIHVYSGFSCVSVQRADVVHALGAIKFSVCTEDIMIVDLLNQSLPLTGLEAAIQDVLLLRSRNNTNSP